MFSFETYQIIKAHTAISIRKSSSDSKIITILDDKYTFDVTQVTRVRPRQRDRAAKKRRKSERPKEKDQERSELEAEEDRLDRRESARCRQRIYSEREREVRKPVEAERRRQRERGAKSGDRQTETDRMFRKISAGVDDGSICVNGIV